MILHCMSERLWNERKEKPAWGYRNLERDGLIHCSPAAYFWRVAPNFKDERQPLVLVCIDESKLGDTVRYEDGGDTEGRLYPHVYGPIPKEAVLCALPFLRDANGDYVKNPELQSIQDE